MVTHFFMRSESREDKLGMHSNAQPKNIYIKTVAELEKILWEGRNKFFSGKTLDGRAEMKKKINNT